MTDDQVRDVRDLTRAAGIKPTTTRITGSVHPVLVQLAPGERVTVPGGLVLEVPGQTPGSGTGGQKRSGGGRSSTGGGQAKAPSSGGGGGRGRGRSGATSGSGGGSHSAASFSGRR